MSEREWFLGDKVQLFCGDSAEILKKFPDNSFDSVVCDPPYALASIVKRFANSPRSARTENTENPYGRTGRGFMGQRWDVADIAHSVSFWSEVWRVVKPGGHVVAFAATRTYHRLACAIEDAGFEIRDQIQWVYGSGFPKSHDTAKAVDRFLLDGWCDDDEFERGLISHTAAYLEGSGTALKPAQEPICLARKPLSEPSVAQNALAWGTGALNIDDCRVHSEDSEGFEYTVARTMPGAGQNATGERKQQGVTFTGRTKDGRWPANFVHDGSQEVVEMFPAEAGATAPVRGTEPSKSTKSVYGMWSRASHDGFGDEGSAARFFYQVLADDRCDLCNANIAPNRSPTGSIQIANSARAGVADSQLLEGVVSPQVRCEAVNPVDVDLPGCHQQAASFAQSNAETWPLARIVRNVSDAANLCDLCATAIAQEIAEVRRSGQLARSHLPASIGDSKKIILLHCLASYVAGRESTDIILTTMSLKELFGSVFHAIAEYINSEKRGQNTEFAPKRLFYSAKADADDRIGSKHPTVKPVDLMQWLVRLVTPKGGLVLEPFAGTGTTAEAAFREGVRCVLIESEPEYQDCIRRRMRLVLAGPDERRRESIKAKLGDQALDAGPLFTQAVDSVTS